MGLTAIGTLCARNLLAAPSAAAVEVGPDHPVGDLRTMQVEPYIAAHPSKPGSLIVSGAELIEGRFLAKAYARLAAGKSWLAVAPGRSGDGK